MNRLALKSALLLTAVMFITSYVAQFLTTVVPIWLELPGPYSDGVFAWIWFALNVLIFWTVAFLFCRWLARLVEKKVRMERVFE